MAERWLPVQSAIAGEARWVYAGGMRDAPAVPPLWQTVLTIGDTPAADETAARAVLVAVGLDGENIELEPEEPEYGLWLVGLPFLPLPTDEGMTVAASETAFILANGEFQMEVPLP